MSFRLWAQPTFLVLGAHHTLEFDALKSRHCLDNIGTVDLQAIGVLKPLEHRLQVT